MIVGTVRDILIIFLALTSIVVWVLLGVAHGASGG
jgi:hypothetical protein